MTTHQKLEVDGGFINTILAINNSNNEDYFEDAISDAMYATSDYEEDYLDKLTEYLQKNHDLVGMVSNLLVPEEKRGEGIGNKLMAKFCDQIMANSDIDILLARVEKKQKDGFDLEKFYEKFGFKAVHKSDEDLLMVSKGYEDTLRKVIGVDHLYPKTPVNKEPIDLDAAAKGVAEVSETVAQKMNIHNVERILLVREELQKIREFFTTNLDEATSKPFQEKDYALTLGRAVHYANGENSKTIILDAIMNMDFSSPLLDAGIRELGENIAKSSERCNLKHIKECLNPILDRSSGMEETSALIAHAVYYADSLESQSAILRTFELLKREPAIDISPSP